MRIALGTDHAGFRHKEAVKAHLKAAGHEVIDYGCKTPIPATIQTSVALPHAPLAVVNVTVAWSLVARAMVRPSSPINSAASAVP